MGLPFVVEFNEYDPTLSFYICRTCLTHIALSQDFHFHYTMGNGMSGGLFNKVVNVLIDETAHPRKVGLHTVEDIYCLTCEDHLGWKFVEVPEDEAIVHENMVQLQMGKLLMWKGNQIVDEQAMGIDTDNPEFG